MQKGKHVKWSIRNNITLPIAFLHEALSIRANSKTSLASIRGKVFSPRVHTCCQTLREQTHHRRPNYWLALNPKYNIWTLLRTMPYPGLLFNIHAWRPEWSHECPTIGGSPGKRISVFSIWNKVQEMSLKYQKKWPLSKNVNKMLNWNC